METNEILIKEIIMSIIQNRFSISFPSQRAKAENHSFITAKILIVSQLRLLNLKSKKLQRKQVQLKMKIDGLMKKYKKKSNQKILKINQNYLQKKYRQQKLY